MMPVKLQDYTCKETVSTCSHSAMQFQAQFSNKHESLKNQATLWLVIFTYIYLSCVHTGK